MKAPVSVPLPVAAAILAAVVLSLVPAPARGGGTYNGDPDEPGPSEPGGALVVFSKDHPVSEAKADKALVYVLRPTSFGAAIKSFFFCDDDILGINQGSSYFFAQVAPGNRVFWSKSENVDALALNVEAGKTYYLQQHVEMGGFRARTRLELLDDAAGQEALAKCKKHGTLTDSGRAKGKEIVRAHKKDVQEDLDRRAEEAKTGS
jgi:hypothetical protein